MKTIYNTKVLKTGIDAIEKSAELLKAGEVVAIPTETVYGLGANALNTDAVKKIYIAKGRPSDNPLIVHVHSIEQVELLVTEISSVAKRLMDKFWPGPLTLIMKKKDIVPDATTGNLQTVAVRMPNHPLTLAIIKESDLPLAAPSANLSGKPSPTTAEQVLEDMDTRIPLIVDGGPCQIGLESTVLDITSAKPIILRPGAITHEMLLDVIDNVEIDKSVLNPVDKDQKVKSPGVKYRHYAPNAKVKIFKGTDISMCRYISKEMAKDSKNNIKSVVLCCRENSHNYYGEKIVIGSKFKLESIAENLFNSLREIDKQNYDMAYAEYIDMGGLSLAIMNRLLKAASHNVEEID